MAAAANPVLSRHYTTGDVIDLRIEKIVPRGFGLGFAENLTVLVPRTAPGDVLRVRIGEIKKRMAFAEIVEIRTPGPKRVQPPCESFGTCGGCDFQQMSYPAQLDAKVGLIRDCLSRIGKIDYESEIKMIASPQPFGYRSRARWHLDRENRFIGYTKRESHDVVNINSCPILTPGLQSTLEFTRQMLDWDSLPDGKSELEAATGDEGRVSTYTPGSNAPSAELSFSVNGDTYAFSAGTFFQANKFLIPELIDAAVGDVTGDTAFDLYCGVGLFTLPLARRFKTVLAVEENLVAAELAEKNIRNLRAANTEIVRSSVADLLKEKEDVRPDFILLDPPRSGPEKTTIANIASLKPPKISYVSCEPSILARDLRIFADAGYEIEKVTALDLFPQTHHVETVVRLAKQ